MYQSPTALPLTANSQLYLSVPNITYLNSNAENTLITISDVSNPKMTRSLNSYYIGTNDTGSFFNLGSFAKETKLKVTLSFLKIPKLPLIPLRFGVWILRLIKKKWRF